MGLCLAQHFLSSLSNIRPTAAADANDLNWLTMGGHRAIPGVQEFGQITLSAFGSSEMGLCE